MVTNQEEFSAFSACCEQLENIIVALLSPERVAQEHGEVEIFIQKQGTELLRLTEYFRVGADSVILSQAVLHVSYLCYAG